MSYLSENELLDAGFRKLGKEVKISSKASIYNPEMIEIGDFSRVDDFCVLSGSIHIGRFVHFAPMCLVAGGDEGIEFGDFSGLAYQAQVFSQSDDYSGRTLTNPTVPAKFKNEFKRRVRVGKHVIIGASSVVFPGVDIAEGCSIGAMALVTKSTEPWGIYVGNPATRVKERHRNIVDLEREFLTSVGYDPI